MGHDFRCHRSGGDRCLRFRLCPLDDWCVHQVEACDLTLWIWSYDSACRHETLRWKMLQMVVWWVWWFDVGLSAFRCFSNPTNNLHWIALLFLGAPPLRWGSGQKEAQRERSEATHEVRQLCPQSGLTEAVLGLWDVNPIMEPWENGSFSSSSSSSSSSSYYIIDVWHGAVLQRFRPMTHCQHSKGAVENTHTDQLQ